MAEAVQQRTIATVSSGAFGHTHIEFSDGTKTVIHARNHTEHAANNDCHGLKPGDLWPIVPEPSAVDEYAADPVGEAEEDADDVEYEKGT